LATIVRISIFCLSLLLAAGCSPQRAQFNGVELTGADWGRDFSLLDPDGKTRNLADFRGKYVLLFFGYTQCPDVCPTTLARAVEARRKLGSSADSVQVIFITVDPERDTPALLRDYTKAFDPSFLGLYGDAAQTAAAAKEFKVFFEKAPSGSSYTVNHTALTYVIDPRGRLRLMLQHALGADELAADLRTLMKESP